MTLYLIRRWLIINKKLKDVLHMYVSTLVSDVPSLIAQCTGKSHATSPVSPNRVPVVTNYKSRIQLDNYL